MRRSRPRRRGFTLLELAVVSVIVGILSSAAIPTYTKLVDRVREAEVISYLSALQMAQFVYFLENGRFTGRTEDLLITAPPMQNWRLPGAHPNWVWSVTEKEAQITASSTHAHADPASHEVRGRVNSEGVWLIEIKRPGETVFTKLGA